MDESAIRIIEFFKRVDNNPYFKLTMGTFSPLLVACLFDPGMSTFAIVTFLALVAMLTFNGLAGNRFALGSGSKSAIDIICSMSVIGVCVCIAVPASERTTVSIILLTMGLAVAVMGLEAMLNNSLNRR